ncbi:cation:proton antiporter domain-containing protein [Aliikangiella sp. IMCC44359]|uniref:cation:proton antiporter domain-containing protein n=1 Tax=Aliikangiella sp. IMCC44359 TaxID=3459125 RepID=UPI00403AB05C
MDFTWAAIALNDFLWIGITFVLGLISKKIGLPPLVGFLTAGFILSSQNIVDQELLKKMADLGITLLLFTIGLKINIRNLIRPQVWGVTVIHTSIVIVLFGAIIYLLAIIGTPILIDLSLQNAILLGFAFSFSSTVFVVKVMEDKGEYDSLHGRIAIGILIIQDIFAVTFLAVSANKMPSIWALSLILLIPFRIILYKILDQVGRGELLILFGFLLAIGGAEIFELVGVKGDLGALFLGAIIATHNKAEELVKNMLGFKDLFLLGFFLSIGLYGQPDWSSLILALLITPFIIFKSALFFALFTRFNLRARTALLSTINLSNYSEFSLIVIAIGVANQWIDNQWLITMAMAISFSFIFSAALNKHAHAIYTKNRHQLNKLQSETRLSFDQLLDIGNAEIAVIGMGTIGTGAYDQLCEKHNDNLVGIDIDLGTVNSHIATNRNVILGDPSDADFWERVNKIHKLDLILLTLPQFNTTIAVVKLLRELGFSGQIASIAKFPDEVKQLEKAGVNIVSNIFVEAGAGFANHIASNSDLLKSQ